LSDNKENDIGKITDAEARGNARIRKRAEVNNDFKKNNDNSGDDMYDFDDKPRKKSTFRKILKILLIIIVLAAVASFIFVGVVIGKVVHDSKDIDPNNIYSILSENSVMYDINGEVIENVMTSEMRTNLDYDEMPKQLIDAFVAIEDKTFWKHNGFNFVRIIGAIVESIRNGESISGTSTITQQLARNVFLPDSKSERTMTRKIEEAYYTFILEKNLTKEQIIEAYLNTIYLGFNSYGVEAAAESYFGKPAGLLSLAECSALATITKNPSKNALIKRYYTSEIDPGNANIISTQGEYTLVYNDEFKQRQAQVLKLMVEQGTATKEEADAAYAVDIKSLLNPPQNLNNSNTTSSYFTDYAKDQAIEILMDELGLTKDEAETKLFTGGLSVYTSFNPQIQEIVENAYKENSNFPSATAFSRDSSGNAINSDGNIMLYNMNTFFESDGSFALEPGQYGYDDYGNLYIYKGNRLTFYETKSGSDTVDISINFKPLYTYQDGILYISNGGTINVNPAYKTFDAENNLVIQKECLDGNPDLFRQSGDRLLISPSCFSVNQSVMQPQSAMVIMDQYTGQIAAMVGGRNIEGDKLYNRANSARQPGSSIKPLAAYVPALQKGMTGATILSDSPHYVNGKLWPKNSYSGYKGNITLRKAVQVSSNVTAVKVVEEMGFDTCFESLENMGITTLDDKNDRNASALGIGGMTRGLKPIESCGAYATIANGGKYNKPTTITKILDRNGGVIYEYKDRSKEVFDEGTAFLMTDILKSVVSGGTGTRARIYSNNSTIPVAGKTGTTTKNYDAWFCGFTPYYTAVVWVGNDYNIQLSNGSGAAAQLWSTVMKQVHENLPAKTFEQPETVASSGGEYYVIGRTKLASKSVQSYRICTESGLLARNGCPHTTFISSGDDIPTSYCNIHSNTAANENSDNSENTDNTNQTDDNNNQNNTPADNGTAPQQTPAQQPATEPAAPVEPAPTEQQPQ